MDSKNCRICESVLSIVILVMVLWPNMLGTIASKWVVIVAAVLLLLHAIGCKDCVCSEDKAKKKRK